MIPEHAALLKVLFDMVDGSECRAEGGKSAQYRALIRYTKYTELIMSVTGKDRIPINDRTHVRLDYVPLASKYDSVYTFHLVLTIGYTEVGYVTNVYLYEEGVVLTAMLNVYESFPSTGIHHTVKEFIETILTDGKRSIHGTEGHLPPAYMVLHRALPRGGRRYLRTKDLKIITDDRAVSVKLVNPKALSTGRYTNDELTNTVFEPPMDDLGIPAEKEWAEYTINGVTKTLEEWCAEARAPIDIVRNRMEREGMSLEKALTTRIMPPSKKKPAPHIKGEDVYYFKGRYRELQDIAKEYDVPLNCLRNRIRKGYSVKRAVNSCLFSKRPYPTREEMEENERRLQKTP